MRAVRGVIALVCLLIASPSAAAQGPEVRVQMTASPARVRVGEVFALEVRAEAEGARISDVALPDLADFEVLSRQVAQPLHFQFGSGRPAIRASVVHQLQLRALRPGSIRIEPARALVEGRRVASNPLTIEVEGASAIDPSSGAGTAPPPIDPNAPAVDGAVFDPELFLRTVVDKSRPAVGEQVTVTVYLYTTVGGQPQFSREPTTDGFWVHDLLGPSRPSRPERQVVHGIPFRVYALRRFAAFPLRAGRLEIGAPELRLEPTSIFGMRRGGAALQRRGVPITLDVQPLPPPAPPGAVVGSYAMEASVDRTAANVGDAITLSVKVQGTGNLNDVRVELPELPGVRALEPEIDDRITSDGDLVGGERLFRFLLVAEAPGEVTVPSLKLPYFDPRSRSYGTAETAPISLTITGTAASPAGPVDEDLPDDSAGASSSPEALRLAPPHPHSALRRARPPVSAAPWYRWALAAPPLLWILVLIGRAALARARRGAGAPGADGYVRTARRRLRAARALEREGDAGRFYAEVAGALSHALEPRLEGPVGGLTHAELRGALEARGMPEDLAGRIIEELESCDFARFSAAGASADEMERCRQRVEALLDRLQSFRPTAKVQP